LSLTMLSLLGSTLMAGWFSAAARIVEAAHIGHIAALTALYPVMANSVRNIDSLKTFKFSWMLLLIIASGASILLFFLAKPIVDIFFGTDYQSSILVLKILSFTFIPYTINSFLSLAFLAEKREKAVVRVLFVSFGILLVSNLWLIPRAGQIGAGWAFLTAETLQSSLLLLEWKMNSSWKTPNFISDNGVSYELSDLSR
jgi:PST family polysaccharide transporter